MASISATRSTVVIGAAGTVVDGGATVVVVVEVAAVVGAVGGAVAGTDVDVHPTATIPKMTGPRMTRRPFALTPPTLRTLHPHLKRSAEDFFPAQPAKTCVVHTVPLAVTQTPMPAWVKLGFTMLL